MRTKAILIGWLMAGGMALACTACGGSSAITTASAPSTSPACGASPTLNEAGRVHCLPTPSASGTAVSPAPPQRIEGFQLLPASRDVSIPLPALRTEAQALSAPAWTLLLTVYQDQADVSRPGWSLVSGASSTGPRTYQLAGPWGTLRATTATVQAALTPTLAPEVVWSYAVTGSSQPLTASQAMDAAQLVTSQMEALAAVNGVDNAAHAINTMVLTNPAGNRLVLSNGAWFINNTHIGWDSAYFVYPTPPILHWIQETL